MSNPAHDIKSLTRLINQEAERVEHTIGNQQNQIVYLSDKLNRLFHSLRQFNMHHGRDLDPDTLDAFNSTWRSHEATFDTWQSYQKRSDETGLDMTFNLDIDNE
jgi:hypothetical protein